MSAPVKSPESPPDGYLVVARPLVTVAYACARPGCPAVVPAAEARRLADGERYCRDCALRPDTGRTRLQEHRAKDAEYKRGVRARAHPSRLVAAVIRSKLDLLCAAVVTAALVYLLAQVALALIPLAR